MNIYMIGIGGIGMSALAQWYIARGHTVSGEDRSAGVTTELLGTKGVAVYIGERDVPREAELVVYSDAIPDTHRARVSARAQDIRSISYFEALGELSKTLPTIAVAGVHGKTTTTAMLVKILKDAGKNPTAIIGSIVKEFDSNFVEGDDKLFVVEACEYRDHVLRLSPTVLVITNIEWDHTDWFNTFSAMQETFRRAIESVPESGAIVTNPHDPAIAPLLASARARIIDYTAESVPQLALIGSFNEMNARAAKATASYIMPDLEQEQSNTALATFKGTWRRFERKGITTRGALVYDDYAHHPTAIQKTLSAVKETFPNKRIVVAFHPHLYSRTRDLLKEFATAFSSADIVLVAPIYSAREEPISGITSNALAQKITEAGVNATGCVSMEEVLERIKMYDDSTTILITMGAGDIYTISEKLI